MYGPCGSHHSLRSQAALKEAGTKALELIEGFPGVAAQSKACQDEGGTSRATDEIDVYICISHELMGQYAMFYFFDASKDNAPRSWIW